MCNHLKYTDAIFPWIFRKHIFYLKITEQMRHLGRSNNCQISYPALMFVSTGKAQHFSRNHDKKPGLDKN